MIFTKENGKGVFKEKEVFVVFLFFFRITASKGFIPPVITNPYNCFPRFIWIKKEVY